MIYYFKVEEGSNITASKTEDSMERLEKGYA